MSEARADQQAQAVSAPETGNPIAAAFEPEVSDPAPGAEDALDLAPAAPALTVPEYTPYIPDTVLVRVDDDINAEQLGKALADNGSVDSGSVRMISRGVAEVSVTKGHSVAEAVGDLSTSDVIKGSQPDYLYVFDEGEEEAAASEPADESVAAEPAATEDASEDATEPAAEPAADEAAEEPAEDAEPAAEPTDEPAADEEADFYRALIEQYANFDYTQVVSPSHFVNDPYVGKQWALDSINARAAWDELGDSYQTVGVAVFDCGFDLEHEDLADAFIPEAAYNAFHASEGEGDVKDVTAGPVVLNHGNHIAGIIAASADNATGIAGVAPNAKIIPVRVANDETDPDKVGATTSALVEAFDYVIANRDKFNIRVINLSAGVTTDEWPAGDIIFDKIDEAFEAGIITVCSAGNDAKSPYYSIPGDYSRVVNVINLQNDTLADTEDLATLSWTDSQDVSRAKMSNYNAAGQFTKNIAAPGTDVLSTTTAEDARYELTSGTSVAAPHVAGVIAMMLGAYDAPKNAWGAQHVVDALYSSARQLADASFDAETGYGELDAQAAVRAAKFGPSLFGPEVATVGQDDLSFSTTGDGYWTYESSDPEVVSVDLESGIATAVAPGYAVVVASDGAQTLRKGITVKESSVKRAASDSDVTLVASEDGTDGAGTDGNDNPADGGEGGEDPAHEHTWGEPTYTWADDLSEVTAERACTGCDEKETETVATTSEVTIEPTATEPGEKIHTATFTNPAFENQTQVEEIPPTGEEEEKVTYSCTKGNGSSWMKGSAATLGFTFARSVDDMQTYKRYTGVKVDGKAVDATRYTTKNGGLVILLVPSYLESLSAGTHNMVVSFDDGTATAHFTVRARSNGGTTPSSGGTQYSGTVPATSTTSTTGSPTTVGTTSTVSTVSTVGTTGTTTSTTSTTGTTSSSTSSTDEGKGDLAKTGDTASRMGTIMMLLSALGSASIVTGLWLRRRIRLG